jgi:hypothetical protein
MVTNAVLFESFRVQAPENDQTHAGTFKPKFEAEILVCLPKYDKKIKMLDFSLKLFLTLLP